MATATKYKFKEETPSKVEDLFNPYNVGAKPFLKWAGGKGQLLERFQEFYPKQLKQKKIKTYYEPFLGSGAVFFDIAQNYEIESAYLYDVNEELILTYRVIQKKVDGLLDILHGYQKKYLKLGNEQRKKFFYNQRLKYNSERLLVNYNTFSEKWFSRAAQLIFLNRTCFNGLYRVNSKGEFNSPAGDYDNPTICDEQNLLAVHHVLQIAEIKKADFRELVSDIKDKSFVYFDPPYRPISKTANFKSYSNRGFTDSDQRELSRLFKTLDDRGVKVMLSNSDPKNNNPKDNFFDELYKDYHIFRVPAKRMINSNAAKRGAINEIVVTNYPIKEINYIPANDIKHNQVANQRKKIHTEVVEKIPISKIKINHEADAFHKEVNTNMVLTIINQFDIDSWAPVIINKEGYLLDGQHRLIAAKKMGLKYVDVVVKDKKLASVK